MNKKKTILMLSSLPVLAFGSLLAVGAKAPEGVRASDGNATGTTPVTTLTNGGFETGDLTGWEIISGDVWSDTRSVISAATGSTYWTGRHVFMDGEYALSTFYIEDLTGTLRSETFSVIDEDGDGRSFVSFMLAGGKDQNNFYVAINDAETGSELIKQSNVYFSDPALAQSLITYIVEVSDYIGKNLYFTIVDNPSSDAFKAVIVDDFEINLEEDDILAKIAELREFADTTASADPTAQPAYQNLYYNQMRFPSLGGDAPVIADVDGYALDIQLTPQTINLHDYLAQIEVIDDGTSRNELVETIEGATKDGSPYSLEGLDLSALVLEDGTYEFTVGYADAAGQKSTTKIRFYVSSDVNYGNEIVNGDFETGNMDGWTVSKGKVDVSAAVISDSYYWAEQVPYNQHGSFHFDGWKANTVEAEGYAIKSSNFTLGGSGFISVRMGGRAAKINVYTVGDDQLIKTVTNTAYSGVEFPSVAKGNRQGTMVKYLIDLSEHLGKNLYVELEDDGSMSSDWAVAFFDEVVTYYEEVPAFGVDILTQNKNGSTIEHAAIPNEFEPGAHSSVNIAYTFLEKYFDTFRALGKNFTYCDAQNVYDGTLEGLYQEYLTLGSEAKVIVDATADFNYAGAAITSEITTDCTVGESLANYARIRQTDASGNGLFQGAMADDNTLIAILSCGALAVLGLLAGGIVLCKKKKAN